MTHLVVGTATGRLYDCRDLERVDHHLAALSASIVRGAHLPALIALYRSDQNELLARRQWLVLTREAA